MNFILTMAWRDSRASRRRLALFSLSVVLGIAALVAIGSFSRNLRAAVEDQAKGPILNPIEMAMPDQSSVLARLKDDPKYPAAFAKAFPDDKDPVTYDNVARAIAAFERTLITRDRLDAFLHGRDSALTAAAAVAALIGVSLGAGAGAAPTRFLATDGAERFARVGSRFLGRDFDAAAVECIDV